MDIPVKQITEMQEYYNKTILLLGNYENPEGEMFLESLKTNIERHFPYYGTTVKKLDSVSALLKKTPRQILHFWLSNFAFVIADDTLPSGEIVELEHCLHCGAVAAIIARGKTKEECRRSSWMTIDYHIHSTNFKVFEYEGDIDDKKITELLGKIIPFAEKRKEEVVKEFEKAHKDYAAKRDVVRAKSNECMVDGCKSKKTKAYKVNLIGGRSKISGIYLGNKKSSTYRRLD